MAREKLFRSVQLGLRELENRIAMAPMTRNRAHNEENAPTDLHVEYYSQRAGAGLIISEGAQISEQAQGYVDTAGIHSEEQIEGWSKVLDAVHGKAGVMYCQLWHVGRMSHKSLLDGKSPLSSTAQRAEDEVLTEDGYQQASPPRVLSPEEIEVVVSEYREAASNAREAGFDGVQVHAANGYLIEQFLHDSINDRGDEYGRTIENRSRFLFEVLDAVIDEVGANKVCLRLSPSNLKHTDNDSNSKELYQYIIEKLNEEYSLALLELLEPLTDVSTRPDLAQNVLNYYGPFYDGPLMTNGGYDRESAIEVVEEGKADMVAFGRKFIANPDLVERLRLDAPLNEPDEDTFFGGGARGYVDYPTLDEEKKKPENVGFE